MNRILYSLILCHFAIFGNCQVRILSPSSLIKTFADDPNLQLFENLIPASTSTFGSPAYGESFIARPLAVPSDSNYCKDDYAEKLSTLFNVSRHFRSEEVDRQQAAGIRNVFVVKRGGCSFVTKVAIAEHNGADGVIIVDSDNSTWSRKDINDVVLADDGHGSRIGIPSLLVVKRDGEVLWNASSDPSSPVLLSLEWNLPQRDGTVTVDFWTSASSSQSVSFLEQFASTAVILKNKLNFKIHYYIFGLPHASGDSLKFMCYDQDGKYCAAVGYPFSQNANGSQNPLLLNGMETMKENHREMCLYQSESKNEISPNYSSSSSDKDDWWSYVKLYPHRCSGSSSSDMLSECSMNLIGEIVKDKNKLNRIQKCIQSDATAMFQHETQNRAWGVSALRINGARFSGSVDGQLVTQAVCTAFLKEPPECKDARAAQRDIAPTINNFVSNGYSASLVIFIVFSTLCVSGIVFYFYHRQREMIIRNQMRHEVVLQVKSHMHEYYNRMEDTQNIPPLNDVYLMKPTGVSNPAPARSNGATSSSVWGGIENSSLLGSYSVQMSDQSRKTTSYNIGSKNN